MSCIPVLISENNPFMPLVIVCQLFPFNFFKIIMKKPTTPPAASIPDPPVVVKLSIASFKAIAKPLNVSSITVVSLAINGPILENTDLSSSHKDTKNFPIASSGPADDLNLLVRLATPSVFIEPKDEIVSDTLSLNFLNPSVNLLKKLSKLCSVPIKEYRILLSKSPIGAISFRIYPKTFTMPIVNEPII